MSSAVWRLRESAEPKALSYAARREFRAQQRRLKPAPEPRGRSVRPRHIRAPPGKSGIPCRIRYISLIFAPSAQYYLNKSGKYCTKRSSAMARRRRV